MADYRGPGAMSPVASPTVRLVCCMITGHRYEVINNTFQVLFIASLFCAWNITNVEINSGVYFLLKLNPPSAFVYLLLSRS